MQQRIEFETIRAMAEAYGEPCSNCTHSSELGGCDLHHRLKTVDIVWGHIPEVTVRRKGGCPDHDIKTGDWWGEDPIGPFSGVYGGSKTNILG